MFSVKDKVIFITGGTAGIGLATAKRLAAADAKVVIVGRRDNGHTIANSISATFLQADVTNEKELVDALDQTVEQFGPIDVLFNNAGIENSGPTIEEAGLAEFQRLIDIDLKAPYALLHHGPKRMRDGGSIINTASDAGLTQVPGYAQYSAAKAAIISLSKTAALELAPRGIRVNAICPGPVWSEMLPPNHPEVEWAKALSPQERIGEPEEVAALVHFLACDDCRYITGAAISIDGGSTAGFSYPVLELGSSG